MLMSLFQKSVYPRLPVKVQNVAISVFGYLWNRRRFGGIYRTELIAWKHREQFSAGQWKTYQEAELHKLLLHAITTVPFYNEQFTKAGFTPSSLTTLSIEDLPKLPCLE